ncbi:VWA domain-containing protein [Sneathiella sp. P13V-1]|uniref:vWA domain-containing protein n=1 Tax=Sneathiella sp. P13V-1 TaxID=2697366 RepID=UPI00187B248C|nr:VWA domain-containing protein [Sneathiella sp. P13V-1]MBE7637419.1 VWA domain-containing protein [Sneathiella sp. P13V-1]
MTPQADPVETANEAGTFAENILHFARTLRRAGLPVGPGRVIEALRAVECAGLQRRDDFYWTLHSVFVNRHDQWPLFDQAFHIFWKNPDILKKMMDMMLPTTYLDKVSGDEDEISKRLSQALAPDEAPDSDNDQENEEVEINAELTTSESELLQEKDFEDMSTEELEEAKKAMQSLKLPIREVRTRRLVARSSGNRIDMRRTLRAALRSGGATIPLRYRTNIKKHPPLVIMCDISGSMSQYSRMLLHFLHAITNDRDRVHTFVFGTRLTNITRYMRYRDVDEALDAVSEKVEDWSGGTRIGSTIEEFNKYWSRRVLGQGAVVLFISDGLDRDQADILGPEMERLHKSCRQLIWLNPLLRYDGFEPKARGIKAILPHVDIFRTVHNLQSLSDLSEILSQPDTNTDNTRRLIA